MSHTDIVVYGTAWCGDCKRVKQLLGEHRIHYRFVDIDADPEGRAFVEAVSGQTIPVIAFEDGSTLVEPTNAELADELGIVREAKRTFYDVIVVGSGPAGLTAAFYAAREGFDVLVVERGGIGGQAGVTERLDNFPGFPDGVGGGEFADRLRAQAVRFGVEILAARDVTGIEQDGAYRLVTLADGTVLCAFAVLLATGSTYRRLGVEREADLLGAGVHYCATCDGAFYRDRPVLVVGGGNSAGEEALFLTRFASHVTIATRGDSLRASKVVAEKVAAHPAVTVLHDRVVQELRGDPKLKAVVLRDTATGGDEVHDVDALFVFIGFTPNTTLAEGLLDLAADGSIRTDHGLATSVPGIFAAGDCRAGATKQAASAAGEGAAAAIAMRAYLEPLAGGVADPRATPTAAVTI